MNKYSHYNPSDLTHIVKNDALNGKSETTLCGLNHDGELSKRMSSVSEVLSDTNKNCNKCRASFVKIVMRELDGDVEELEEGDVIEYWTHNDPTDSGASLCIRKEGVITEVPPWKLGEGEDWESETTDGYKVQLGSTTYGTAKFDRIWRVNHKQKGDIL